MLATDAADHHMPWFIRCACRDLEKIWILRKFLNEKPLMEAMEFLLEKMKKTKSNEQFLKSMNA